MFIDFLQDGFARHAEAEALVWRGEAYNYGWLDAAVRDWCARLSREGVPEGAVVSLEADFSPTATALMLALIEHTCTVVPLTSSVEAKKPEFREIAQVEVCLRIGEDDAVYVEPRGGAGVARIATHAQIPATSRAGALLLRVDRTE